jgi:hypothetical protein
LRAPASIIAIAAVLIIASVLIPAGGMYFMFANPTLRDFLWPVMAIETVFSMLGIITSIGLLRLHEAARKAAIFFATVPILILFFALLALLATARSTHNFFFAGAFLVCGALFVILIPIGIWWRIVLGRESVRSQFR